VIGDKRGAGRIERGAFRTRSRVLAPKICASPPRAIHGYKDTATCFIFSRIYNCISRESILSGDQEGRVQPCSCHHQPPATCLPLPLHLGGVRSPDPAISSEVVESSLPERVWLLVSGGLVRSRTLLGLRFRFDPDKLRLN
jgi:hypothetical protein